MNDDSILGSVFGQLGQTIKKAGQQVIKLPEEAAMDVGGQVSGSEQPEKKPETPKSDWESDEERKNFLKSLYGPSQPTSEVPIDKAKQPVNQTSVNSLVASVENKKPSEFQEQIKDKSPEEQKELIELRNQLHREIYFDPTFNRPKQQEERPAEKVESEKKKEMMDLQKKEDKKPQPLAVTREQNKAEQFRGAAG